MSRPNFSGLSHVCIIVNDLTEAFSYYERILCAVKYFYFIDKYGLQWEFEQGHTDIGD